MNNAKYDIIIIGGGISGLSLAYFLAEMDRNVLVIDKKDRVGGAIESLSYDDFNVDLGAHTGYNSYTSLLEIIAQTSVNQELQERIKQKYYFATPKGFQKLTKPLRFAELLRHLPKALKAKKDYKSVQEYYTKILGRRNYQNFAQHFFKAVLSQSADNYPAAFFLKRRAGRNKAYPLSYTFRDGMQTLINALQQHNRITITKSTNIEKLTKKDSFEITTKKGIFNSENIAFACCANAASELLKDITPKLAAQLSKIPYQTVSSLGIIVDKQKITNLKTFAGLLTTTNDYTSIVSRDIAPNEKYRGFTIHTQGKVPAEQLKKTLCTALNIEQPCILSEKYKNNRLPQLQKRHEDFLEELTETISKTENIYITGNYFQGLSLEDCVQRSQEEAVRLVSQ